jgi:hypothetical protein
VQWLLAGVVLIIVFVGGQLVVVYARSLFNPFSGSGPGPQPNPLGAFAIEVSESGGAFRQVLITPEATECSQFRTVADLYTTCVTAPNLIPSIIGGGAQGKLNQGHTPEYDALVWRARANGDPQVCDKGGLLAALLTQCHDDAIRPDYSLSAGRFVVRVLIGGAIPSPGATGQ